MSSNNNSGGSDYYDAENFEEFGAENVQSFESYQAKNSEAEYVQNFEEIGAENGEAANVQNFEENGAEYFYFYEENLTDDKVESFEAAKNEETQERPDYEEVERKFFKKNPKILQLLHHHSFGTEETDEVAGNATSLSFLQVSPIVAEPTLADLSTEMPGTSSTSLLEPLATPLVTPAEGNVDTPRPKSNASTKSSSIDDTPTQIRSRSLNFSAARSPVTRSMTRQSAIPRVSTTKPPKRLARKSHKITKRVGKAAKKAPAKKSSKGPRSAAKK